MTLAEKQRMRRRAVRKTLYQEVGVLIVLGMLIGLCCLAG